MTWPASDVVTTNADAGTDSPATFRTDVLDLLTKFNLLRNHVSSLGQTLLNRATAALMRTDLGAAASGANSDITSLAAPALGAATATTAAAADNDTSVATTAFVQQELTSQAVKLTGNQTIAGVKTFSSMPVMPAQSMVRLNTSNGTGSTNTSVARFLTVVTNQGSDITYADSATLGASFTINANGVYSISFTTNFTAASDLSVTRNSTTLAGGLPATLTETLFEATTGATSQRACASGAAYLTAGDVIRAQTTGVVSTGRVFFTIGRAA